MTATTPAVSAIDLFCGVGGLSQGLQEAGISVTAGIDTDPKCKYPFEANIGGSFLQQDVRTVTSEQLDRLWQPGTVRLLAGCAPCQPFSAYRRGVDTSGEEQWPLLGEFGRLVRESLPDIVTMENVPRLVSAGIFKKFLQTLAEEGYEAWYRSFYGPRYGLPQHRRRLVLLASRIGRIDPPEELFQPSDFPTVRQAIGNLPPISAGGSDPHDVLHRSRTLTEVNLRRIRASRPGGTWHDWPVELRAPCHQRATGATFRNVYARMEWDAPSPTITTMFYNFGTGRFGHPEQDRALSLREAAILQGFPLQYDFVRPTSKVEFNPLGRLIGNAVPPVIARTVGAKVVEHVAGKRSLTEVDA